MYIAIIFWVSGILLTFGFNYKALCPDDSSFSRKLDVISSLFIYYLIAWPFFLGDSIRKVLDENYE